jgi:hypothetical protein
LSQSQWTNGNANQPEDFDPKLLQHAPDLAVFAFIEHDFQPRVFPAAAQHASLLGSQQFPARPQAGE